MSFNIFGSPNRCDIRLGYIDPERGYVTGIGIVEANKYASLNPGAQFIFESRDVTRYLNINEVNNLKPNDLIPKDVSCNVTGFVSGEVPFYDKTSDLPSYHSTKVDVTGGKGVGAVARAVIGQDGSILKVNAVRGGFGYQFEPNVTVNDESNIGSGAVVRGVLGEKAPTTIYYDQKDDFELYDFTPCNEELADYGLRFGREGEVLGKWDPTLFATLANDPIKAEIKKYQEYLAQGIQPFWTTRSEEPQVVAFGDKRKTVAYNVSDLEYKEHLRKAGKPVPKGWSSFMNRYAISPVEPQWFSDVVGTDYAGVWGTFEWEKDFPYSGEYTFTGMGDNIARIFLDNKLVVESGYFQDDVLSKNKITIPQGIHLIKVDIFNQPFKEIVLPNIKYKKASSTDSLDIVYRGLNKKNKRLKVSKNRKRIDFSDDDGKFNDSHLEIKSGDAVFSDDGRKIIGTKATVEFGYYENPKTNSEAVRAIVIGNVSFEKKEKPKNRKQSGTVKKDIVISTSTGSAENTSQSTALARQAANDIGRIFSTTDFISKANRPLWRTNIYSKGGFLNDFGVCPFDTVKDYDTDMSGYHPIQWSNIDVPVDGNYVIIVAVDDSAEINIIGPQDTINIKKEGFIAGSKNWQQGTGPSRYIRFLKKGKYRIEATLLQRAGRNLSFKHPAGQPVPSAVSPKFIKEGNKVFLVCDGVGSADIDFSLRTSDTSSGGYALSEVSVGNANLKRTRSANIRSYHPDGRYQGKTGRELTGYSYKSKETITQTGSYSAGQRYEVVRTGHRSSAPSPRVEGNSVFFNDSGNDSFDAELKIVRVKNKGNTGVKGINPMALAISIEAEALAYETVVGKRWNENPMGAAFTIEAPLPPNPQEPIPIGEGRCPKNPIWTTRFPGGTSKWWPVNHSWPDGTRSWSKFMNRFAISPVPPRSELGTEGSGTVWSNTWTLDIPYDGYYGLKGAVDNGGRILIDGQEKISGGFFSSSEFYKGPILTENGERSLANFKVPSPPITKIFLSQGTHQITTEVDNRPRGIYENVVKKIFDTRDWAKPTSVSAAVDSTLDIVYVDLNSSNKKIRVRKDNKEIQLKDSKGSGTNVRFTILDGDATFSNDGRKIIGQGEVTIRIKYDDYPGYAGEAVRKIKIGGTTWTKEKKEYGEETKTINLKGAPEVSLSGRISEYNNVNYSGPDIFRHNNPRWSFFMNRGNISPFFPPLTEPNPISGTFNYVWSNVNFIEDGQYDIMFQADVNANQTTQRTKLYIDDELVRESNDFSSQATPFKVRVSKGLRTVRVEQISVANEGEDQQNIFITNPQGFALKIDKTVRVQVSTRSWLDNPVGISAILIPPPCPKVVEGKGVIVDYVVEDPGNGYPVPAGTGAPTILILKDIVPTSPGINYNPGDLVYVDGEPVGNIITGPFGTVEGVQLNSLQFITQYPNITLPSDTGIGFRGRPVFEPIVVPEDVFEDDLLVVTDLVGLKQTGYVNGKPYYGSVFSKDGVLYAGIYETIGELIPVYETLQESIDNQIQVIPSAIIRQGTDITNNDPRLNIPNTPNDLV